MIETTTIQVGKCAENAWRRENLLKSHNCIDKGGYFEVAFQWIEHTFSSVKQINLIYQIVK
jgi:hypothetical protein